MHVVGLKYTPQALKKKKGKREKKTETRCFKNMSGTKEVLLAIKRLWDNSHTYTVLCGNKPQAKGVFVK